MDRHHVKYSILYGCGIGGIWQMANNWTREQLEAITDRDCNLPVAAAAGAGKTAVLVERIIRKITDPENPVDIDKLLVVTFTNAAATRCASG